MTQYLKENAVDKIAESTSKQLRQAVVRFTVDEQGEIANPQIAVSSEDALTDQLLLEAITLCQNGNRQKALMA
ncbi:MAG: energy transducer TonB [Saprospiraceae bacterium]|nr:energy transducer TonB [Saprospiraceae bacterium]